MNSEHLEHYFILNLFSNISLSQNKELNIYPPPFVLKALQDAQCRVPAKLASLCIRLKLCITLYPVGINDRHSPGLGLKEAMISRAVTISKES